MCHFKEMDFGLKNIIFSFWDTEAPFRANLLFGMLKAVLSEPPFRDQPYLEEKPRALSNGSRTKAEGPSVHCPSLASAYHHDGNV